MSYLNQIENMTWSFSRLDTYETCPYSWYMQYILHEQGENNFFSESGIAMHKTLELLEKKEIGLDDAIEFFNSKWNPNFDIKQSIIDNSYEAQMNYLTGLTGKELDEYEILGVEKRYKFKVDDSNFVGMIDLLLRNKNGELIIVDHKSHRKLFGKNGQLLKSETKTLEKYKRQQYLYSIPIYEEYGEYPSKLVWNHFKSGDISIVQFDIREYTATIEWAKDTIKKIKEDADFLNKEDYFFCHNICNFRNTCEYLEEEE